MRRNIFIFIVLSGVFFASGCATKVERVGVEEQIDLSGSWNDYDASLVSQEMIKDCVAKPWFEDFVTSQGRNPVVIVGHIENNTYEHINAGVFIKFLERELLNSGKITFVTSPEEREQIRAERNDQQAGNTTEETRIEIGRETGADFMLIGSMNSTKDEVKGKFVVLYQVNLELIDLATNRKAWIGQKQIKKFTKKGAFSW